MITSILYHKLNWSYLLLIVSIFLILLAACKTRYQAILDVEEERLELPEDILKKARKLPSSLLIPYEDKIIRTYFHFFNDLDSSLNFNQDKAAKIVYDLLENANRRLSKNDKMNLPIENTTATNDSYIRYKLSSFKGEPGIFFHYEKEPRYFVKKGKKKNLYDRKIIKKYAIHADSVLNVFVMPFDPDQVASGEQKLERTAIALGTTIKLPGIYQRGIPSWEYAGIFNHEVGHVLGLRHSWNSNDGCNDTPLNDNCWVSSKDPPCDGIQSNNLMDYNAHQSAITPCQIARMQASLVNPGKRASRLTELEGCKHLGKEYIIRNEEKWSQPVRLSGNIIIEKNGFLYLRSLLQMAENSSITIKNGGTLILENASIYNFCGLKWKGIFKHPKGHLYIVGKNCRLENLSYSSPVQEEIKL